MAYGIANLGSGFLEGFRTVDDYYNAQERQKLAREEIDLRKKGDARAQATHDFDMGVKQAQQADGEALAKLNQEFIDGQQARYGVEMGPPGPDGTWGHTGNKPMTLLDAERESDAHLKRIAPLVTRIYARADPKAAAEFALKFGDTTARKAVAEQVALGKMLLSNPMDKDTIAAVEKHYKDIPDGYDIDTKTWRQDEKGNIHFQVFNKEGERVPRVMTSEQIKGMLTMGLTAPQIITEMGHEAQRKEQARHYKATEDATAARDAALKADREADNARAEREFKIRIEEIRAARANSNAQLQLSRESRQEEIKLRGEQTVARQRDEVFRGVSTMLVGDPKTLQDRSPEEQMHVSQSVADAIDIVELNPSFGKTAKDGARAAGLVRQIASGNARVFADTKDPTMVIVDVGGKKILLPKDSYTMSLYGKASKVGQIPK